MANHKSKAGARLRQPKRSFDQQQWFHQALNEKLTALDGQLHHFIQGQQFYQQALMALTAQEDDFEHWLTGSLVIEQQLRWSGDELLQQLSEVRPWIKGEHHG